MAHLRIDVGDGHHLHVEELVKGRDPPIVLLHGFGASSETWWPLHAGLCTSGHRVVAIDRLGFGRSDRPRRPPEGWGRTGSPYRPSSSGAQTLRVLDALDIAGATLIGHSAGAVPAVLVTLAAPARVTGLGLLAPSVLSDGPPPLVAAAFGVPGAAAVAPWMLRRSIGLLPRALRRAWHDPAAVDDACVERYRAPFRTAGWEHALVEMTRATERLDLASRLGEVRAPAAVVVGASDRIVVPRDARRVAELLGGDVTFTEVPAAGHLLHEERPDDVLAALAPLLRT